MTRSKSILISGCGIAGTALAYWLHERGFEPVIVERAPHFRDGGYIIDFWGIGYEAAARMDLIPALRMAGYQNDRLVFVRRDGTRRSGFGSAALKRTLGNRFLSIARGDLARAIYGRIEGRVETIFGDRIVALCDEPDGVVAQFRSGTSRRFDLVIGADGLHSAVRGLILPDRAVHENFLGYYAAFLVAPGYPKRDEHTYLSFAAPGRQISRFALRGGKTGFMFVSASKNPDLATGSDIAAHKRQLHDTFAADRWNEWPQIAPYLDAAEDLYFDAVTQIDLPVWSNGRVALVGDAAYCPSLLAGEGAAFAMAGAYILAGELDRADGDHFRAFNTYERRFRPFILRKQKAARSFASSFTPRTVLGLTVRDLVLRAADIPFVADLLMRAFLTDSYTLPRYDGRVAATGPA
jgi:2-polyprenyl-6-methoxyphenol hydroxylase-like FAD-dependent oxidoreductase